MRPHSMSLHKDTRRTNDSLAGIVLSLRASAFSLCLWFLFDSYHFANILLRFSNPFTAFDFGGQDSHMLFEYF